MIIRFLGLIITINVAKKQNEKWYKKAFSLYYDGCSYEAIAWKINQDYNLNLTAKGINNTLWRKYPRRMLYLKSVKQVSAKRTEK